MIDRPLEIPLHSGEALLVPAGVDLVNLAAGNRERLDRERRPLWQVPLAEWRRRARRDVLDRARTYTAALGMGPVPEGDLLLATGHQPVFGHPGIWVKYLLLDRLASPGHTGLAVTVDSDAMEEAAVEVPTHESDFLERRRVLLRTAGPEEPYEGQAAPTDEEWRTFLARVDALLESVREEAIRDPWRRFAAQERPAASGFSGFVTTLRRRYEGPRRFLDVPVSRLAETEPFRAFFLHVAAAAETFREIHNRHLEAYREEQRIRTDAQPFPNLDRDGEWIELPFWAVAAGRRRRLYFHPLRRTLRPAGAEEVPLPGDLTDAAFASLRVRPRALALTTFIRLLLVDLFIHGVSGGRYDRVTDAVCGEFLGVAAPAYAVASATLHLPFAESVDTAAERQALGRMIQEARHNPERLLAAPSPEQRGLTEEKWRLIRRLEETTLARRERRELTREIRSLNEQLSAALKGRVGEWETRLAVLADRTGPPDAATHRGYPFFLYRRDDVEALVSKMLETER